MNCCWILLLLFLCGQNGNGTSSQQDTGCGCNQEPRSCDEPRFEPRFEPRPFSGNGATCGCEEN